MTTTIACSGSGRLATSSITSSLTFSASGGLEALGDLAERDDVRVDGAAFEPADCLVGDPGDGGEGFLRETQDATAE